MALSSLLDIFSEETSWKTVAHMRSCLHISISLLNLARSQSWRKPEGGPSYLYRIPHWKIYYMKLSVIFVELKIIQLYLIQIKQIAYFKKSLNVFAYTFFDEAFIHLFLQYIFKDVVSALINFRILMIYQL